jgi:hypothetical protein
MQNRLTLVLAIACASFLVCQGQKGPISEQTFFTEDEPLQQPVTLSSDVLRVLLKTKQAKVGLEDANDSARENPARMFRAAGVHLSGSEKAGLVVIGIPPMRGADNCWFWIVRSTRRGPKVVLFAGGYSLELLRGKTNGFRNIRSTWSSPSETEESTYRFDGQRYKLWKRTYRPNR